MPRLLREYGGGAVSALVVAAFALLYFKFAASFTGGEVCAPLDDTYIYLQYAERLADGAFFRYSGTDAISFGTTSVPYSLLLAAVAWLGVRGQALLWFSYLLGGALLAIAAATAQRWAQLRWGAALGTAFGVFVASNGLILWSGLSGMDTAFYLAALLLSGLSLQRWSAGHGTALLIAALAVLALSRPEGGIQVVLTIGTLLAVQRFLPAADKRPPGVLSPRSLPLAGLGLVAAAVAAQPLLIRLTAGQWMPNGSMVKGVATAASLVGGKERLFIIARNLWEVLTRYVQGMDREVLVPFNSSVPPLLLPLVCIGTWRLIERLRQGEHDPAGLAAAVWYWSGLGLALLLQSSRYRYHIPYLPVMLLLAIEGAFALREGLSATSPERQQRPGPIVWGIMSYCLLYGLMGGVLFANVFASNSRYVQTMNKATGEFLREHTPAEARVVVHDAGALAWFSRRFVYDGWGLTTTFAAKSATQGSGAVFEAFERHVPHALPTHFAIFPSGLREFLSTDIASPELARFSGQGSAFLAAPEAAEPVVITGADWSGALRGQLPVSVAAPGRLALDMDVADLDSEAAAGYRVWWHFSAMMSAAHLATALTKLPDTTGEPLLDGGRHLIHGYERFGVRVPTATSRLYLVVRADGAASRRSIRGLCEGCSVAELDLPEADTWREELVVLDVPPEGCRKCRPRNNAPLFRTEIFTNPGTREVQIEIVPAEGTAYVSYHYWVYVVE